MKKNDIHSHIESLLDKHQLKQAIDKLAEVITEDGDWNLYTKFSEVRNAYGYMLEYMRKGMPDPDREKLYKELLGKCYIMNDKWTQDCEEKRNIVYLLYRRQYGNSEDIFPMHKKLAENRANLAVVHMMPEAERKKVEKKLAANHEELLKDLFYSIWSSDDWNTPTCDEIYALLTDQEVDLKDRATLVSAITLGVFNCFEPQKITLICRLADNNELEISVRALIGLMLVVFIYEKRLENFPELIYAIQSLGDSKTIRQRIHNTQIQLLRCRETQEIDRKMRDEIIPAMLKNPSLDDSKLSKGIIMDTDEDGKNPERQEWVENDKIIDKLDEMIKWQMEGADVYMSTFSQLKHFSFFDELHNWMRPFDSKVPEIAEILPADSNKSLLEAMCSSHFFCNSDKYSFCFTLQQLQKEQRQMMIQRAIDEKDLANEGPDTISLESKEKEAENIGNSYIHDLYRFFKLSLFRNKYTDPFTLSLILLDNKYLSFLINDTASVMYTFNYLIDKEYYEEAYKIGTILENENSKSAQFYQKMGYALQKCNRHKDALDYYTKSDIVNPDSLWTMRHIAQCYRTMGEYEKALQYYKAAHDIAPENMSLLLQAGECHAILKQYDEAFEYFFKVEYLSPQSLQAWRAIAWCSFLNGNDKQARHYYSKLIEEKKAKYEDYINAAHVEWISGKKEDAVNLYKKAATLNDTAQVLTSLKEDKDILLNRGATDFELTLLHDIILE